MSVFVEYDKWGRMGNRMFCYAFAKILAKKKNTDCFHEELINFNITSNIKDIPSNCLNTKSFGSNRVDYQKLLDSNSVLVNSFVQKIEYYSEERDYIRSLFNIDLASETINKDKLVLHIRDGDYNNLGVIIGYDFYKQLIKDLNYTDIIIVTDDSRGEVTKKLLADGCTLSTEGHFEFNLNWNTRDACDFKTLLLSENIVISQSTFSWWAGFLGIHKNIFFPFPQTGKTMWQLNPKEDDIDLYFNYGETKKYIQ